MKKTLIGITTGILLMSLTGCTSASAGLFDFFKKDSSSKEDSSSKTEYVGKIEDHYDRDGILSERYHYVFNEEGQNELVEYYLQVGLYSYDEYSYESGNLVSKISYTDETPDCEVTYEYDDSGNLVRENYYFSGTEDNRYIEYEYDKKGLLIGTKECFEDDELIETQEYEYDSNGRRVNDTITRDDGYVEATISYKYDSKGRLSKKYVYSDHETRIEYRYDSGGYLIKETQYSDNRLSSWIEYQYEEEILDESEYYLPELEDEYNADITVYSDLTAYQVKENVTEYVEDSYASFGFHTIKAIVKELVVTVQGESAYAIVDMTATSDVFRLNLEYKIEYEYDDGWEPYNIQVNKTMYGNSDNNEILGIDISEEEAENFVISYEGDYEFYNVTYDSEGFEGSDKRAYHYVFTANYEDETYGECEAEVEVLSLFNKKTGQWGEMFSHITGEHIKSSRYKYVLSKNDFKWW